MAESLAAHVIKLNTTSHLVSSVLVQAVVAAEDRRFWRHKGFDPVAAIRAVSDFVFSGRVSGASTIEQQLVRTLRKRYELTLRRKVTEIALAFLIACEFPKKTIISLYLHVAYFGWHATGIEMAASRLGVPLNSLTKREAATIAAMLKLPMPRLPSDRYAARLTTRVDYILAEMNRHELSSPESSP